MKTFLMSRCLWSGTVAGSLLIGGAAAFSAPAVAAAAAVAGATSPPRLHLLLDNDWKFRVETAAAGATQAAGTPITNWRWQTASADAPLPTDDTTGWQGAAIGQDVFKSRAGFAWFRTDLGSSLAPAGKTQRVIHFEAVDDNAAVYFNGKLLRRHSGWDEPFDVNLTADWKAGGPNTLTVLVENTAGAGGISGEVTQEDSAFSAASAQAAVPAFAQSDFNDHAWRTIHLPHDYVVEGTFNRSANGSHGFLPTPPASYRKTFTMPAALKGKSVWLQFDGVYRDSVVYLNGREVGRHPSGYTGFRVDIGAVAHYGDSNVLAVSVNPRKPEGWWYEGGGIYRHVYLNAADPYHIVPHGVFVTPVVKDVETAHPSALLTVKTNLINESKSPAPQERLIVSEVFGPDGKNVAKAQLSITIAGGGGGGEVSLPLTVPDARLWSLEKPQLYRLHTDVIQNGRVMDSADTPFGIRTLRFDAEKGFFLNNKPIKIKGTCNHQDFAGVGIGVPDSIQTWRIQKLKEMGSNAYRCSHNPPAPEILDACDRLGMLVMDENRHLGDTFNSKTGRGTPAADNSEVIELVQRDRNHPSVIMWSLCNEEPLQGSAEGARIFGAMKEAVLRYDSTRPVTSAMNGGWGQGISLVEDLQGCNYNSGGYDAFHKAHPTIPLYGSETASTVSTRGIYANDKERGYVSAYDVNRPSWGSTAEGGWKPIAERSYVAGGFVWTGFDYKGEPTPYEWPCINSHFGILDICGFPKDNYWYYQAWWGDKPVVHLLPHWNGLAKEGEPVSVWCHSNAEKVELFLNGKSLGVKAMPRYEHLEWSVPYTPGTLEARGYNGGATVATDKVETTGAPAALRLKSEWKALAADGEDSAVVAVEVVDAQGRVVPTAGNTVTFTLSGPGSVAGAGNGDPSSHEPDKASQRSAFNGLCMAIVQAGEKPGGIILRAASPGLKPAELRLSSRKL